MGSLGVRATRITRILRCLRLLRVAKLQAFLKTVEDQIASTVLGLCLVVVKLLLALTIIVHFCACFWYALGESSMYGWTSHGAAEAEASGLGDGLLFWYFSAMRWTL